MGEGGVEVGAWKGGVESRNEGWSRGTKICRVDERGATCIGG